MVAFFQVTLEHTSYSGSYIKLKNSLTASKINLSIQESSIKKYLPDLKWISSFWKAFPNNHHNSKLFLYVFIYIYMLYICLYICCYVFIAYNCMHAFKIAVTQTKGCHVLHSLALTERNTLPPEDS